MQQNQQINIVETSQVATGNQVVPQAVQIEQQRQINVENNQSHNAEQVNRNAVPINQHPTQEVDVEDYQEVQNTEQQNIQDQVNNEELQANQQQMPAQEAQENNESFEEDSNDENEQQMEENDVQQPNDQQDPVFLLPFMLWLQFQENFITFIKIQLQVQYNWRLPMGKIVKFYMPLFDGLHPWFWVSFKTIKEHLTRQLKEKYQMLETFMKNSQKYQQAVNKAEITYLFNDWFTKQNYQEICDLVAAGQIPVEQYKVYSDGSQRCLIRDNLQYYAGTRCGNIDYYIGA